MIWFKRLLLRIVFGRSYDYMVRSVAHDPRISGKGSIDVDLVGRRDGIEVRVEADWIKKLARIVVTPKRREQAIVYRKMCRDQGLF